MLPQFIYLRPCLATTGLRGLCHRFNGAVYWTFLPVDQTFSDLGIRPAPLSEFCYCSRWVGHVFSARGSFLIFCCCLLCYCEYAYLFCAHCHPRVSEKQANEICYAEIQIAYSRFRSNSLEPSASLVSTIPDVDVQPQETGLFEEGVEATTVNSITG
jgi:hypothetical protein